MPVSRPPAKFPKSTRSVRPYRNIGTSVWNAVSTQLPQGTRPKNTITEQIENLKGQQETLPVDVILQLCRRSGRPCGRTMTPTTKEERGAGESRGTCAAPPRDRSRQTQRYGRRCHGRSRRANRNVVPRSEPLQYEKQITDSQGIIADKYQRIGKLQQEIKRCTPDMRKRSPTLNRRHNSY